MFPAEKWTLGTVTQRTEWNPGLFTFQLDLERDFLAGQFAKLGMSVDGVPGSRAYSIASAPGAPLEFYVVEVEGGMLSPRLAALRPGHTVQVSNKILGGFTTERVEASRDLWLIATGTGLAPYISMLRHGDLHDRFDNVVIIQGASFASQLGYADELEAASKQGTIRYLRCLSRDDADGCLRGRITNLFTEGALEDAMGLSCSPDHTQVMLCGNPAMINEMRELFKGREMNLHTPRRHGNVHLERYW